MFSRGGFSCKTGQSREWHWVLPILTPTITGQGLVLFLCLAFVPKVTMVQSVWSYSDSKTIRCEPCAWRPNENRAQIQLAYPGPQTSGPKKPLTHILREVLTLTQGETKPCSVLSNPSDLSAVCASANSTSPSTASSAVTNVLQTAGVAASPPVMFCFSAQHCHAQMTSSRNCATRTTLMTQRSKSARLLAHSVALDHFAGEVEDRSRTKTAVSV